MADIEPLRAALLSRVLGAGGEAPQELRRAAFDATAAAGPIADLIAKVARHAAEVTDDDFRAARASGLSEDQLFELVVCAALGQATRQHDAALAALAAATGRE